MAPEKLSRRLPTGWTFENEVMDNDKRVSYYYCKATGQQYYTFEDLMRYVKYAKDAKVGFYSPKFRSSKREKKGKHSSVSVSRKKSGSSDRSKPSSDPGSKPSTDDQNMSSDSPSECESVDKENDPDYMPISEASAKADSKSSKPEAEAQEEDSTAESNGQESAD